MSDLVRDQFRIQARACDNLGSPFTAALCRAAADVLDTTTSVGRMVLGWTGNPMEDALALRLCGAMHRLVLTGVDAELTALYPPRAPDEAALGRAFPAVLERNAADIVTMLASPPQTNEVARSGMLLPGFLAVARGTGLPLSVFEMGASAGLNQLFDQFHYTYGEQSWGDGASPVRLAPEVRGPPIPLYGDLRVIAREACDVSPVDLSDVEARLRLRSYLWPDQTLRRQRIDAAIEMAVSARMSVSPIDALTFVTDRIARPTPGVTRTLCNSIMWQYMAENVRHDIKGAMKSIGATATREAPLAWVSMEPVQVGAPHATLFLSTWPGGATRAIAKCDYHGRWIEWTDA